MKLVRDRALLQNINEKQPSTLEALDCKDSFKEGALLGGGVLEVKGKNPDAWWFGGAPQSPPHNLCVKMSSHNHSISLRPYEGIKKITSK